MEIYLNILEHLKILKSTKDPICYQKSIKMLKYHKELTEKLLITDKFSKNMIIYYEEINFKT